MTWVCRRIADWCRQNDSVTEEDYPIVVYGLEVMLNNSVKMLGILLIGLLLGHIREVILSMAVFCSMRYWAGGYHSDTHIGCFSIMLIPCLGPSFLTGFKGQWVLLCWGGMILYSLYEIVRHAPRNSKVNPIRDLSILRRNRICAIVECVILIGIAVTCRGTAIPWLIIVPLFVEAVTISRIFYRIEAE